MRNYGDALGCLRTVRLARRTLLAMYPIPVHEFRRRLRKWQAAQDLRVVRSRDETGRPTKEYWSQGVCRLRVVYYPDGAELQGDRGVRCWLQRDTHGPIAFGYHGEAGP